MLIKNLQKKNIKLKFNTTDTKTKKKIWGTKNNIKNY